MSRDPELDLLQQELSSILLQMREEMEKETDDDIEVQGIKLSDLQKGFEERTPKMDVQYKMVHKDAVAPKYNYPSDSGFDLYSVEDAIIPPLSRILAPTGLCFKVKDGYEIQVRPKSGLSWNDGLTVLNTPGTVDSGYNGEIKVILYNSNQTSIQIKKGQKIAQACVCPVANGRWINLKQVDELEDTDRGDNGFGSTGK